MINNMRKGFTLIEVMIATSVLALGIVFIYEAFFTSLDLYNYYEDYLNISPWLNEKMWEAKDTLSRVTSPEPLEKSGSLIKGNRQFSWDLSYALLDKIEKERKLYRVDLTVYWQVGKKSFSLSRNTYALYAKK